MLSYRRFDRNDWMGFAGAEKFASGREPIIAGDQPGCPFQVEGMPALLVAGGFGVEVYWGAELQERAHRLEESVVKGWADKVELDVLVLLETLGNDIDLVALVDLGFRTDLDE